MSKYTETAQQALELSKTCLEGLEHGSLLLDKEQVESSIQIFVDSVEAFYSMEAALQLMKPNPITKKFTNQTASVREAIDAVVTSFEQGNPTKSLLDELIIKYKAWGEELPNRLAKFL